MAAECRGAAAGRRRRCGGSGAAVRPGDGLADHPPSHRAVHRDPGDAAADSRRGQGAGGRAEDRRAAVVAEPTAGDFAAGAAMAASVAGCLADVWAGVAGGGAAALHAPGAAHLRRGLERADRAPVRRGGRPGEGAGVHVGGRLHRPGRADAVFAADSRRPDRGNRIGAGRDRGGGDRRRQFVGR